MKNSDREWIVRVIPKPDNPLGYSEIILAERIEEDVYIVFNIYPKSKGHKLKALDPGDPIILPSEVLQKLLDALWESGLRPTE